MLKQSSSEKQPLGGKNMSQLQSWAANLPSNNVVGSRTQEVPSVFTKKGREMIRQDQRTKMKARADYNEAKLIAHRNELATLIEKAQNQHRAELAVDAMQNMKAVDAFVSQIAQGSNPALELMLRDIQTAYNAGEQIRVFKRGQGL